jgi:hypothetical protein
VHLKQQEAGLAEAIATRLNNPAYNQKDVLLEVNLRTEQLEQHREQWKQTVIQRRVFSLMWGRQRMGPPPESSNRPR